MYKPAAAGHSTSWHKCAAVAEQQARHVPSKPKLHLRYEGDKLGKLLGVFARLQVEDI